MPLQSHRHCKCNCNNTYRSEPCFRRGWDLRGRDKHFSASNDIGLQPNRALLNVCADFPKLLYGCLNIQWGTQFLCSNYCLVACAIQCMSIAITWNGKQNILSITKHCKEGQGQHSPLYVLGSPIAVQDTRLSDVDKALERAWAVVLRFDP